MKKHVFFVGMALAFVLVLGGCDNGNGNEDGNSEEIKDLPSFEGQFVASEAEASTLASGAEAQIQAAIKEALAKGGGKSSIQSHVQEPQSSINRADVSKNGRYTYNGVTVDYTVTGNTTGDTYPLNYTVEEVVTIDGTYSGYKITGRYNINLEHTFTSSTAYSISYNYDCVYAVSYKDKGMKLVYTGDMVITSDAKYTYNVHYSVYDNDNTLQYNYDYNYPE